MLQKWQQVGIVGLLTLGGLGAGYSGLEAAKSRSTPDKPSFSVYVSGAIRRKGMVKVPAGSRVSDAIDAAGGALPGADLESINPTEFVEDGTQIVLGNPGAFDDVTPQASTIRAPESKRSSFYGGSTNTKSLPAAGSISINSADQRQLEELPGVGPKTAQAILNLRMQRGGFRSIDELLDVKGIGPKTLEKMRPFLSL